MIVNAAAFHPFGSVVETELETWNRCLMVNVGSIYLLGHFGVPEMKKRGGGSIINLASVQGHACQRGVAAYAASKGAVHSLTRALALDHAARQHTSEFDQPGSVRTPMLERSAGNFLARGSGRRGLQALGQGSSAWPNWDAGRSGGAGGISGVGSVVVLHRWRLPGGWRPAGWHRSAVISFPSMSLTGLCRAHRRSLRRRRSVACGTFRGLLDRHQSLPDPSLHLGGSMRAYVVF